MQRPSGQFPPSLLSLLPARALGGPAEELGRFDLKDGAPLTLLLVLGVPLAIANIRTLYSWFPALKPAVANAIDVVTGYVPPAGPSLKVTHECRYLDRAATQCWDHLKIVSLNDEPI